MNLSVNSPPAYTPVRAPAAAPAAPASAGAPAAPPSAKPVSGGQGAGAGVSPFEILNQALQSNIFSPEEKKDLADFGGILVGYVNEVKIKSSNGEQVEPLNSYLSKDGSVAALAARAQSLLGRFVESKSAPQQ